MTQSFRNRIVGVVEYQAGNIHSIQSALDYLGARSTRVRTEADIDACTHLILPGVGAFGFCADRLGASGLLPGLSRWALQEKRPLLGICVGMQLFAEGSDESPDASGLGWLGGKVRKIQRLPGVRVPHVGWNTVSFTVAVGDFAAGASADFYFDHSYFYDPPHEGLALAHCNHGRTLCVAARRENIISAQFHPEKSQRAGMRFLSGFLGE